MHIYYAVGHGRRDDGRHDPGAVSADGRWNEQSAGDHIVRAAAKSSRAAGLEVTDEADRGDPNYPGTIRDANALRPDRLVTVHHDWHKAPPGAFCHWHPGSEVGEKLADAILEAFVAHGLPVRRDWHKPRRLAVTSRTTMPAVLVEVGRIGQAELDTADELALVGSAIAAGVHAHLGVRTGWPALTPREALDHLFALAQLDYGQRMDPTDLGRLVEVLRAEVDR